MSLGIKILLFDDFGTKETLEEQTKCQMIRNALLSMYSESGSAHAQHGKSSRGAGVCGFSAAKVLGAKGVLRRVHNPNRVKGHPSRGYILHKAC